MDINEVTEILGLCYGLKAPQHIFITTERVSSQHNGQVFYRGLQPKTKGDSILLTADMDKTSPIHETIHASLGLGEPGTEVLTRLIIRKNNIITNFPRLKALLSKKLQYQEVHESGEYPDAHKPKFEGRVKHYILQSVS